MRDDFLTSENLAAAEELWARYLADPQSVDPSWQSFFGQLGAEGGGPEAEPVDFSRRTMFRSASLASGSPESRDGGTASHGDKQAAVEQLIRAYRTYGHRIAQIDPLGRRPRADPELELGSFGLTPEDLNTSFSARSIGATSLPLRDIVERLASVYTVSVGIQMAHIEDPKARAWLQARLEQKKVITEKFTPPDQQHILKKLTDAEALETFIQRKFLGAKRFSLEGGETLIPLLDAAIEHAVESGVHDVVIGMAHRGRLNVMTHILHKDPAKLFAGFADADPYAMPGHGDVKYHLGYSTDFQTRKGGQAHISLCFNPSHLGFVGSVAAGRVRAKQDRLGDCDRRRVLGVVVHGDAAFSGQGGTQELLNFSQLPGYHTGGTLHVVVNNQIGFTTSPEYGRSTAYATDAARMLDVPIFHVNGEDPEAVVRTVQLALDYRATFKRDVFIDMLCYRKLGHNESDEPAFTQPIMYRWVNEQPTPRQRYAEGLVKSGALEQGQVDTLTQASQAHLDEALGRAKKGAESQIHEDRGVWAAYSAKKPDGRIETRVDQQRLTDLLDRLSTYPSDFEPHPKLVKLAEQRREMARGQKALDWGAAEALAFASLADEGCPVRLSGQDSGRGTFSHRHAVLHDFKDGRRYIPLQHVRQGQGRVEIIDSPLSESGVLGFDYGFSLDRPEGLTMWEAQFGDFANGAQVIIDQFIASGETKWQRLSGLTLLLPHAFEGQGSEHSSARLERFLALAAERNLTVCYPTTPAQIFHLLRRQVKSPERKPLIVMAPKSLLRHPQAQSSLAELAEGSFQPIIDEADAAIRKAADRIVLCSGKVFYDAAEARRAAQDSKTALVRVEQLYPDLAENLEALLSSYKKKVQVIWLQEEPLNMGAWPHLKLVFGERLLDKWPWTAVARPHAASPAAGSAARHKLEQAALLKQVFGK